jgi:hypothetical protein
MASRHNSLRKKGRCFGVTISVAKLLGLPSPVARARDAAYTKGNMAEIMDGKV